MTAAGMAGFVDSMVGGGGLIQVPALLAAYPDTPPAVLLGTNKMASILGTSSSAVQYARKVGIAWRAVLPAVAVACPASLAGASLVTMISPAAFRALVPFALSGVLVYVLWNRRLGQHHAPGVLSPAQIAMSLGGFAAIGFYDGFFGPGAGSFLMLLFMRVHGFDFLRAAAAARVVNVSTNAGALLFFGLRGDVHWTLAAGLGVCNGLGSVLGARTALRHGASLVRFVFVAVVALLIAKTAWDVRPV